MSKLINLLITNENISHLLSKEQRKQKFSQFRVFAFSKCQVVSPIYFYFRTLTIYVTIFFRNIQLSPLRETQVLPKMVLTYVVEIVHEHFFYDRNVPDTHPLSTWQHEKTWDVQHRPQEPECITSDKKLKKRFFSGIQADTSINIQGTSVILWNYTKNNKITFFFLNKVKIIRILKNNQKIVFSISSFVTV